MELFEDVEDILDSAVAVAVDRGHDCSGWTFQSDKETGYVAWLHHETDEGQHYLFDKIESKPTLEMAANECLRRATDLPLILHLNVEVES